jgi:predicted DNA-binding protein YlxM (UPF0122 family)
VPGKKWGGIQNGTQTLDVLYVQSVKFSVPISYASTEFLKELYVEKKLSLEEVAAEFGISRCAVTGELKSRGIPIRNKGENIKRKRGLGYGQKIKKRKVEKHKQELENITKIKELRSSGYSYHKIAEILNTMKVPTKTCKGKWHAKTVSQVIK